jgi:serine protease AprX
MHPEISSVSASRLTGRCASVTLILTSAVLGTQLSALAAPDGGSAATSGSLDPGLTTVGQALQEVIVSARGGVAAAAHAVRSIGGTVETPLPIVDGVEARVPASLLLELAAVEGVTGITMDRRASFEELTYDQTTVASGFTTSTQATAAWGTGNTGAGVGVAVLDTGISEMNDFQGRLVHGPDLSGEGTLIDSYGHGTVMAGAIGGGGNDSAGQVGGAYTGVAPRAHLVSVKVAGRDGSVDVSTILQGMRWVSAYKDQYNVRVLNISWGVASTQDPAVDPLNHAVQRLWKAGIVVVVAAGNSGPGASTIMKPADDPLVISVGAFNDKGTGRLDDDGQVDWTSQGPTAQGLSKPDLVAPGRSLVMARSYGSHIEQAYPKGLISPSYIRGSGTSQAAAVTSGLVALLVAARPALTPDQVKHLLRSTAAPLPGESVDEQGAGRVRLAAALTADPGPASWQVGTASGLGSIDAARGGRYVQAVCPGQTTSTVITGETDVRCEAWDPAAWTGSSWNGDSWTTSSWNGSSWNGSSWNGSSWNGSSWNSGTWTGATCDAGTFLSLYFGANPPFGTTVPGERSDPAPTVPVLKMCRVDTGSSC